MNRSEWKEKRDLVDNENADTVTFDMMNTFNFRPDLTLPLTGNEVVTILHPLIVVSLCNLNLIFNQFAVGWKKKHIKLN